ncbi:hypothetical protein LINPERPRIM_LOCUS33950 [Linum perenne]
MPGVVVSGLGKGVIGVVLKACGLCVTSIKIGSFVIEKERRGDYLGKIVQVILLVLVWIMFCMNDFIGVDIWSKLVVVGEEL